MEKTCLNVLKFHVELVFAKTSTFCSCVTEVKPEKVSVSLPVVTSRKAHFLYMSMSTRSRRVKSPQVPARQDKAIEHSSEVSWPGGAAALRS